MLFRTDPKEPWKSVDFALLIALQMMEDETCSQCGHPIWICRTNDPDMFFSVKSSVCHATRAVREKEHNELSQDDRTKVTAKEKASWGKSVHAVPELNPASGRTELITRKEYYENQIG